MIVPTDILFQAIPLETSMDTPEWAVSPRQVHCHAAPYGRGLTGLRRSEDNRGRHQWPQEQTSAFSRSIDFAADIYWALCRCPW